MFLPQSAWERKIPSLLKKKKSLLLKLAFSDPDCAPEARENFGPRLTRDGGGTIKQTGEVGLFILEKRSLRRDLLKVCKYQIWGNGKGARLLLVLLIDRTREKKIKEIPSEHNKFNFFLWKQSNTGISYRDMLWYHQPWRYLEPGWTISRTAGSVWSFLTREVGHDLKRYHTT